MTSETARRNHLIAQRNCDLDAKIIGNDDRARSLALFACVVDEGSFSAAGRTLGLTPSAVARAVDRIEARLGVRLLLRSTRALTLTAEGTAPYGQALAANQVAMSKRAVRYLEVVLERGDPGGCQDDRGSQAGGGPSGANFDQCDPVRAEGILGGTATEDAATAVTE